MSNLTAELRASIELESFLSKVETYKQVLPPATYRKLTQRLADLEEHERCNDHANAIDLTTGHLYSCPCGDCYTIRNQYAING